MLFLKNFKKLEQIVWGHTRLARGPLSVSAEKSDAFNHIQETNLRTIYKKKKKEIKEKKKSKSS